MKKIIMVAVMGVWASGWSTWAQQPSVRPAEPKEQVLILTETSGFKQAVVTKVTEALKATNRSCRVASLKALRAVKPQDHQAIVILNEIWAWRLRGEVRSFLKRLTPEQRSHVILVSTVGQEGWDPKEQGVHAITSASTVPNQQKTADFILGRIGAIVAEKGEPKAGGSGNPEPKASGEAAP